MPLDEIVVCFGLSYQFFQQGNILVGTKSGDIYGITEKSSSSQVVVNSHTEGEIWGLCAHPEKDVFVTGSDDKTVRLWDLSKKVSNMLSRNIYLFFTTFVHLFVCVRDFLSFFDM